LLDDGLQDKLLHHLSRDGGEADRPVVPWVLLLALFEDWSDSQPVFILGSITAVAVNNFQCVHTCLRSGKCLVRIYMLLINCLCVAAASVSSSGSARSACCKDAECEASHVELEITGQNRGMSE